MAGGNELAQLVKKMKKDVNYTRWEWEEDDNDTTTLQTLIKETSAKAANTWKDN
mgnify:CR=1 FL=1